MLMSSMLYEQNSNRRCETLHYTGKRIVNSDLPTDCKAKLGILDQSIGRSGLSTYLGSSLGRALTDEFCGHGIRRPERTLRCIPEF